MRKGLTSSHMRLEMQLNSDASGVGGGGNKSSELFSIRPVGADAGANDAGAAASIIYDSQHPLTNSNADRYIHCEYCGLKYKNIQDKNIHQVYYCIGRDLSLDKSILKMRNNMNISRNQLAAAQAQQQRQWQQWLGLSAAANGRIDGVQPRANQIPSIQQQQQQQQMFQLGRLLLPQPSSLPLASLQSHGQPRFSQKKVATTKLAKLETKNHFRSASTEDINQNKQQQLQQPSTNNAAFSTSRPSATAANNKVSSTASKLNDQLAAAKRATKMSNSSNNRVFVLRLRPNQDVLKELDKFVRTNNLRAAYVVTCVGSLTRAKLRLAFGGSVADAEASAEAVRVFNEHMEIVSLVGTLSATHGHHLHISLSDKDGRVVGGHVFGELNVFTTAEIVLGECTDLVFEREFDMQSGYKELVIKSRPL